MAWYESQQLLNEDRLSDQPLTLIFKKDHILRRMIPEDAFNSQLASARHELNIPEEVWIESEGRVTKV